MVAELREEAKVEISFLTAELAQNQGDLHK